MNTARNYSEQNVVYGFEKYTQIELGNINILISVPHDGFLRPENITDRRSDEIGNLKGDLNTRLFAKFIKEELSALFLIHKNILVNPFMVINNLHRIKMDPNRKFSDSCFDCKEDSGVAYKDYHNMITEYFGDKFMLNSSFEQGILVDIHGHNHKENWIELGYLLSNYQLNKSLKEKQAKASSINKLASTSRQSFNTLIRGAYSLGSIMQNQHFRVVPSPSHPSPTNNANYYSGGYITEVYSCKDMSKYRLNPIQIELPASMRHDPVVIESNARKVAACIFEFYTLNGLEMTREHPELNKKLDEKAILNYEDDKSNIKTCKLYA